MKNRLHGNNSRSLCLLIFSSKIHKQVKSIAQTHAKPLNINFSMDLRDPSGNTPNKTDNVFWKSGERMYVQ